MFREIMPLPMVNGHIRATTPINGVGKTGSTLRRLVVFIKDPEAIGRASGTEIELTHDQAVALRDFLNAAIPTLEAEGSEDDA